jgi:hypothetical protein
MLAVTSRAAGVLCTRGARRRRPKSAIFMVRFPRVLLVRHVDQGKLQGFRTPNLEISMTMRCT